jgi:hypothetical protein
MLLDYEVNECVNVGCMDEFKVCGADPCGSDVCMQFQTLDYGRLCMFYQCIDNVHPC